VLRGQVVVVATCLLCRMAGLAYHDSLSVKRGLTYADYCEHYPCISKHGILLAEPATAISDWILTAELVILGLLLLRYEQKGQAATITSLAFILLGLSFGLGGVSHGFGWYFRCDSASPNQNCTDYSWVWVAAMASQAPATALFVVGVCHLVYGEQGLLQSFTWVFAVAVMLFYCFCLHYGVNCAQDWAAFFLSFSFCLLFVGPLSLTVLAYLCKPVCAKSRPPGLGVAIVGWVMCLGSAAYDAVGPNFSRWIDSSFIFHVVFMVGVAITTAGFMQWLPTLDDAGNQARAVAME